MSERMDMETTMRAVVEYDCASQGTTPEAKYGPAVAPSHVWGFDKTTGGTVVITQLYERGWLVEATLAVGGPGRFAPELQPTKEAAAEYCATWDPFPHDRN